MDVSSASFTKSAVSEVFLGEIARIRSGKLDCSK